MICLGILVDTDQMLPEYRSSTLTRGKLSYVTACVRSGRILISRLLNRLRNLSPTQSRFPVTSDMLSDFDWWLRPRDFQDVLFTCDASLHRGGATCIDECISFAFPSDIETLTLHINALKLFVLVMGSQVVAFHIPDFLS